MEIARSDVAALSIPTTVSVPATVDAAVPLLNGVGGLLSAGHWGTAAVVWAFTYDTGGGRPKESGDKSSLLTISDFAALGIRGLKTRDSVRKYRSAWQYAIDEGWVKPARPGKRCALPEQPFESPRAPDAPIENEDALLEFRDAVDQLRRWILHFAESRWPTEHRERLPDLLRGIADEGLHITEPAEW